MKKSTLQCYSPLQSYSPSSSHTSTRNSIISERGSGWGKGCLVPSKLSYVAFQLNRRSRLCFVWLLALLPPVHWSLVWFHRRKPWLTNSGWLLLVPPPWLMAWFDVLMDDMLLWDMAVLLSKSHVLLLQKSSEIIGFFTDLPWIFNPFDGSSTAITGVGLVQHPKQPPI